MAQALTLRVLCEFANGILAHKEGEATRLDPEDSFSVYVWHGALDRLHETGRLSDEEYIACLDLFPQEFYETPVKNLLFVN